MLPTEGPMADGSENFWPSVGASKDSDDDGSGTEEGLLGSSSAKYRSAIFPIRTEKTRPVVNKSTSTAQVADGRMRSSDISHKMAPLLRGGSIAQAEDVKSFVDLMEAVDEMGEQDGAEAQRWILNVLLSTRAPAVLQKFIESEGPLILYRWINLARTSLASQTNSELLLKMIDVLSRMPFRVEHLRENRLERVIKTLSNDQSVPKDARKQATELLDKWLKQATGSGPSEPTQPVIRIATKTDVGEKMLASHVNSGPLPKFSKVKQTTPAVVATRKSLISENPGFFSKLAPISRKPLTGALKVHLKEPEKIESSSKRGRHDAGLSIRTAWIASDSMESPRSQRSPNSFRMSPVSTRSTYSPSQVISSPKVPAQATFQQNLAPDTFMEVTPTIPAKRKVMKTVGFKEGPELVSVRYIEARVLDDKDEESDEEGDEDDWRKGTRGGYENQVADQMRPHDSTRMDVSGPMSVQSRARAKGALDHPVPAFNMTNRVIQGLMDGLYWEPPASILLDREELDLAHAEESTEMYTQFEREATVAASTAATSSPKEPDPEPVDHHHLVKAIPLFEAVTDKATVLMSTLSLLMQHIQNGPHPDVAFNLPPPSKVASSTPSDPRDGGDGRFQTSDRSRNHDRAHSDSWPYYLKDRYVPHKDGRYARSNSSGAGGRFG